MINIKSLFHKAHTIVPFCEPISCPSADSSVTAESVIDNILTKDRTFTRFRKVMGHPHCPFERAGIENKDRSIRYFTEFGACGSFSFLIVDGVDVIGRLPTYPRRLRIGALIERGVVEYDEQITAPFSRFNLH